MADDQVRRPGDPLRRPKDAATLLIWRRHGDTIEVLMGERHGGHKFMPNRYVFPGGGVDRGDARVRAASELRPDVAARLGRAATPARARALALAAVRETFEETGLVIGAPDPAPGAPVPPAWRHFFATGLAPALAGLDYLARAVTPPFRPWRFNARFFFIEAAEVQGDIKGSGELLDLRWLPLAEAKALPMPNITGIVLDHLAEAVGRPPARDPAAAVPLYRIRHGKRRADSE
jgi:8-oxo-dGTP pyrophosphatase MutT (NUDIX family)